jgi:hypothetical protein
MAKNKQDKSKIVTNVGAWIESPSTPIELFVEFADGHREPATFEGVGLNLVALCNSGIYVLYGRLLNEIKIEDLDSWKRKRTAKNP